MSDKFVCCRVLWFTIVLTSTIVFFSQCQSLVRLYLSRPVIMKTTMSRKEKVDLPAVTICNQNAFRYRRSLLSSIKKYLYASSKSGEQIDCACHNITQAHAHACQHAHANTHKPHQTHTHARPHARTCVTRLLVKYLAKCGPPCQSFIRTRTSHQ